MSYADTNRLRPADIVPWLDTPLCFGKDFQSSYLPDIDNVLSEIVIFEVGHYYELGRFEILINFHGNAARHKATIGNMPGEMAEFFKATPPDCLREGIIGGVYYSLRGQEVVLSLSHNDRRSLLGRKVLVGKRKDGTGFLAGASVLGFFNQ